MIEADKCQLNTTESKDTSTGGVRSVDEQILYKSVKPGGQWPVKESKARNDTGQWSNEKGHL